jgi:catalase (peroxidase I)
MEVSHYIINFLFKVFTSVMMFPSYMEMVFDDKFRPFAESYAADINVFFEEFGKAWTKLLEITLDGSKLGGFVDVDDKATTGQAAK